MIDHVDGDLTETDEDDNTSAPGDTAVSDVLLPHPSPSAPDLTTYLATVSADHELDRAALSELGEPVVLINEEGVIVRVNHEAELLTGYTQLGLLGQLIEILVPGLKRPTHVGHRKRYMSYPQARQMGSHLDVSLSLLTRKAEEVPVKISLKPLVITRGVFVSAVIRLRDEVR